MKSILTKLGLAAALALSSGAAFADELTKIVVNRSPVGQFQGLVIATELGYFKERGIEVEMRVGTSPDAAIAELLSGQSHVAMTGGVPLLAAVTKGAPVHAVLNAQNDNREFPTHGLLFMPDSGFKSITDFKGKKIGIPGIASPQGYGVLEAMAKAGMSRDDVELVNLPFPGVLQTIESGGVDAGVPIGLFYDLGQSKGLGNIPAYQDEVIWGAPAVFYAASKTWTADNEELLAKFVEAMVLAHKYANEHPDRVREIDMEYTKLPPDYLKSRPYAGLQSEFDTAIWESQAKGLAKYEFISRVPTLDEFVWSGAPKK